MKAKRMDEIEDLIARARRELNPHGIDPAFGAGTGHSLWRPVTASLGETLGEVYRLKARMHEIAKVTSREDG